MKWSHFLKLCKQQGFKGGEDAPLDMVQQWLKSENLDAETLKHGDKKIREWNVFVSDYGLNTRKCSCLSCIDLHDLSMGIGTSKHPPHQEAGQTDVSGIFFSSRDL